MVLAAITALYALNAIEFGIGWSYVTTIVGMVVVGMVGEPVIDSFAFVLIRKSWARLLTDICTFLLSIVADGLIVGTQLHILEHRAHNILNRYGDAIKRGVILCTQSLCLWH